MTVDLGNITLIPGTINTFTAPSTGLLGLLIGNESGFTCSVQLGISQPRNMQPGTRDFFPIDRSFNGVVIINPKSLLSTANLYPSSTMFFEAVGYSEGFDASSYPMALPRNTTGQFAGTQFAYMIHTVNDTFSPGTLKIPLPPITANFQILPLSLFGSLVPVTGLTTASLMSVQTGGTETSVTTTPGSAAIGFMEIGSQIITSSVNAAIPAQSGNGWLFGFPQTGFSGITVGNWTASIGVTYTVARTVQAVLRVSTWNKALNIFTTIGTLNIAAVAIGAARVNLTFTSTALPQINLPTGTYLYFDLFLKPTVAWIIADNITVFEGSDAFRGIANDVQIVTPGMIMPATGSLTNGNILYNDRQSVYFGGIEISIILANNATQLTANVLNLDPGLVAVNNGIQVGWRTSANATGANAQIFQLYFSQPFKSVTGEQLEVDIFQDTGTEVIQGQIYYYVQ